MPPLGRLSTVDIAFCFVPAGFTHNKNRTGYLSYPGATHKGFSAIAITLWFNGLRCALYTYVVKGRVKSVSVAGHSLGAGVAQLVAYLTQVSGRLALTLSILYVMQAGVRVQLLLLWHS